MVARAAAHGTELIVGKVGIAAGDHGFSAAGRVLDASPTSGVPARGDVVQAARNSGVVDVGAATINLVAAATANERAESIGLDKVIGPAGNDTGRAKYGIADAPDEDSRKENIGVNSRRADADGAVVAFQPRIPDIDVAAAVSQIHSRLIAKG